MTVFLYTLKRLFKNKIIIIFLLILPFCSIYPTLVISTHPTAINIGVVNNDKTDFTKNLVSRLQKSFNIVDISENDINKGLNDNSFSYAVVIPKGFTDDIIKGESPKIQGFGLKEKDGSKVVGALIDSFVYPSKQIASKVYGNSSAFYAAVSKIPAAKTAEQKKRYDVPFGLIIQFVFMTSILAVSLIISDKESKTLYRSLSAPVSMRRYMAESILAFLVLSVLQAVFLYIIIVFGFGANPGKNPADMILLLLIASLVSVALGVAVSSLCRTTVQAIAVGMSIVIVMCMFGGAWGITPTSPLISGVAKVMPFYWAKDAMQKFCNGKTLACASQNILVLLGFAVVFFLAGTWRKSDITE